MIQSSSPLQSRCSTGIPGLDEILNGGLPENRFYLLKGEPGTGKTTLALNFLLEGARKGEPALYITLSETRDELLAVAESHGWNLDKIVLLELSTISEQLGEPNENTFFHPSELELSKTINVLLGEVERVKPRRIALDSLSEFRLLSESALRYRRQMLKLKQYFAGRNCTMLLLDDRSNEDRDLHVESIAHGVITLEKLQRSYGVQRRCLEVNKLRGVKFREGAHDYIIRKGGLRVFPRLIAAQQNKPFDQEPVSSGLERFDALLGGGLDRGTSNLFIGPAGTGKSTLALQHVSCAAKRGEKAMVFAFDESIKTLQSRSDALGLNIADHMKSGLITIKQVDPAELSPGEFADVVTNAVDEDVRLILIDSLNGYLNSMPDEGFLSLQLHELLSYLGHQGVVTIMTLAQHGLIGAMQTPVDVTYLADTVVLLRFFEAGGSVKKAVSVVKKRSGRHEDSIRELTMDHKGVHIGEPLVNFHGVLSGIPILRGPQQEG